MGNRSNIAIIDGDPEKGGRIYLYGHWMGSVSIQHVRHGLRSGRRYDSAYLARIIFSSMVRGDIDGELGFGISTRIRDNDHPVIVVDPESPGCPVWLEDGGGTKLTTPLPAEEFLTLSEEIDDLDELVEHLLWDERKRQRSS
jgi:hypothetical protein